MRRLLVPALALSAVALSACGVRADAHYADTEELREALVNEDFPCHGNPSSMGDEVDFLECDSGIGIYTWEDGESDDSAALESVLSRHAGSSDYVVASDTWALAHQHHDRATRLQEAFGGELIRSEDLTDYLSALEVAYASCDGDDSEWVTYDSDYSVLTVSRAFAEPGSSFSDAGLEAAIAYGCVMDEIDAPTHVKDDVSRTRALDGTRDTSWGDYSASWTFHPDSGLNIQLTDTSN